MPKTFSLYQKQLIKQLVLEADVQQLDRHQIHEYVKSILKEDIAIHTIDRYRRNLHKDAEKQLRQMREHKTAFINEVFFKRMNELRKLQKEHWRLYIRNSGNPLVQQNSLKELRELSTIIANAYEALPSISGLTFLAKEYNGERDLSEALQRAKESERDSSSSGRIDEIPV